MRIVTVLVVLIATVGCREKPSEPTTAAPSPTPDDPTLARLLDEYETELPTYERTAADYKSAALFSEEGAKKVSAFGQSQAKLLQIIQAIREAATAGSRASPAQAERLKRLNERQEAVAKKLQPPNNAGEK